MRVPWNRGGLRSYLLVVSLLLARADHTFLLWGSLLLILGAALQVYAKGCLRQNQFVARAGPYRFIRHPFYSANFLIDTGLAIMSGCWPLIGILPVWWLAVYMPVMKREEATLTALFPEVYPPYQRATSRLFPLRRPLPPQGEGFSWRNSNIASDTVLPRLLRLLALPLCFFLSQEVKAHLAGISEGEEGVLLTVAAMVVTLWGLAWELTRHLRDHRLILPSRISLSVLRGMTIVVLFLTASMVHHFEIESRFVMFIIGLFVLTTSFASYLYRGVWRTVAEGLALTAVVVLCELPWLLPAPVLLYAALALDHRLRHPTPEVAPEQLAHFYHLIVIIGLMLAMVKETIF